MITTADANGTMEYSFQMKMLHHKYYRYADDDVSLGVGPFDILECGGGGGGGWQNIYMFLLWPYLFSF